MSGVSLAQGVVATGTQSLSTSLSTLSTSTSTGINSLSTSTSTGINSLSTAIGGGGGGGVPAYLAVNDIVFAVYNVDAAVNAGDVVNGSDLFVGDPTIGPYATFANTPSPPAFPVVVGSALVGTWRSLQYLPSTSVWNNGAVGGWFRRIT